MPRLKVRVDTRERIELFRQIELIFPDVEFERKQVTHGDYLALSETNDGLVLVERKTIQDLYHSVFSKDKQKNGRSRMSNEVDNLATHENEFVLFLIIGSIMEFQSDMAKLDKSFNVTLLYAEIASLMVREHFHILWARNEMDARIMMIQFMIAVHNGKYCVPARRDPDKLMARILRITPDQYKHLKTLFGSISNIAKQNPESIQSVHGIGPSRAAFILEMLN